MVIQRDLQVKLDPVCPVASIKTSICMSVNVSTDDNVYLQENTRLENVQENFSLSLSLSNHTRTISIRLKRREKSTVAFLWSVIERKNVIRSCDVDAISLNELDVTRDEREKNRKRERET